MLIVSTLSQMTNTVFKEDNASATLRAQNHIAGGGGTEALTIEIRDGEYTIRRLTPLECCRLQGFPDDWCEGVKGSETAQYRMWGNGVALPCVVYVMEGIADILKEEDKSE